MRGRSCVLNDRRNASRLVPPCTLRHHRQASIVVRNVRRPPMASAVKVGIDLPSILACWDQWH